MSEIRRALIVGIDDYPVAPLAGCVNDATAMEALLSRNHDDSPNFGCKLVVSSSLTIDRKTLLEQITALFASEADVALLYFSGHGTENNLDGYLVTVDAERYEEGVALTHVLTLANESKAKEVVVLLDSCQSGAFGNIPAIGSNLANIREGVTVLTASRSTESAMESGGHGLFTSLVLSALGGGAADILGKISLPSVYAYVDESLGPWEQRPLMKAHVSRLVSIRQARPAIPLDILRQFPKWFETADAELSLDASFEPTEEPHDEGNEALFADLQKCRAVKLLEPVGEEHMYYAAVNGKACRLTALGKHYWRQANSGNI